MPNKCNYMGCLVHGCSQERLLGLLPCKKIDTTTIKIPDGWHIDHNPKPIPIRKYDYDFWHDDNDIDNGLSGCGGSILDCIDQIYEIIG